MTPRIYNELKGLRALVPPNSNTLVFGITDTFKKSFASACRSAGVTGFRFHDLRHTAIARMIQAEVTPMEVMKVSGHMQMTTFTRYVNPHTDSRRRTADALAAFNDAAYSLCERAETSEIIN
jgi:integrase